MEIERRLLARCLGRLATAVAFPQKSDSRTQLKNEVLHLRMAAIAGFFVTSDFAELKRKKNAPKLLPYGFLCV